MDDEHKAGVDTPKFNPMPTFKNVEEALENIKPYCDYLKSRSAAELAEDKEVTNIFEAIQSIYNGYKLDQRRLADKLDEEGFARKCPNLIQLGDKIRPHVL